MATTGAHAVGAQQDDASTRSTTDVGGRTPAQWYCLLGGAALLLAGAFGFIADATFDAGDAIQGDRFLGLFEVNGWHNVVHLASGVLLLAAAPRAARARAVALLFGLTYGAVALWGLIDGDTVLGLLPVNPADNVLHIALSAVGVLAAVASRGHERGASDGVPATGRGETGRRIESWDLVRDLGNEERAARPERVARPADPASAAETTRRSGR